MDVTAIAILLGVFFVLIVLGCHISYSMIASSAVTILYLGLSPTQVINTLVDGVDGFTFLAIPFFILAGDIMAQGGISDRLIMLADALVGWMRGGLAMVNIVASLFFGGISGSATADTASLGAILIPMMRKQGYDDEFSAAVTMTSSVQGMLIPPQPQHDHLRHGRGRTFGQCPVHGGHCPRHSAGRSPDDLQFLSFGQTQLSQRQSLLGAHSDQGYRQIHLGPGHRYDRGRGRRARCAFPPGAP